MALDRLVNGGLANVVLGWIIVGIMALTAVASFLSNSFLWGGFSLVVMAVVSVPALLTHDWMTIPPWPLLGIAAIALVAGITRSYPEIAGYLALATLALIVVVELDVFTPVELSRRFAIGFVVLTTIALEALWIIAQFYSDVWLGTSFLSSQIELQEDITIVTVVSFVIGGFFYWYLGRFGSVGTAVGSSDHGGTQ